MSNFVNRNFISLNCNFENDFDDLSLSLLRHSKIDLKLNQLLQEIHHIFTVNSDSTLLKCENLLFKIHQTLDIKNNNCDKINESIQNKICNFDLKYNKTPVEINDDDKAETSESNNSQIQKSRENVDKLKSGNLVTCERKKHIVKKDKSRRSLRIITQSKSITKPISKFKRSALGRYHHLERIGSSRSNNLLHCNSSGRRYTENSKKSNKENVYCFCKKGAFGKMIACDNSSCKIEWFHNKCVNVTDVPNGEWFCPECRPLL